MADQKLFTFESNVYQVKATCRGEDVPTTQQVAVNQALAKQASDRRAELDKLPADDVASFNALLKQHNVNGVYTGGR